MLSASESKASTENGANGTPSAVADPHAEAFHSAMRPDRQIQVKAISGEVVLDTSQGPHLSTVQQLKSVIRRTSTPEGTSRWCGLQLLSHGKVLENGQLLADLEGGQDTELQDALLINHDGGYEEAHASSANSHAEEADEQGLSLTLVRLTEPEPVTEDEVNDELKREAGQFNYKFRPSEAGYDESAWQEYLATRVSKQERQKMRRQLEEEREVKWRVRKVYGALNGRTINYDANFNFQEFVYGDGWVGYDPRDQATLGHYAHMTRALRQFDLSIDEEPSTQMEEFNAEKERVMQAGLLREGPIDGFRHQLLPAVVSGRVAQRHDWTQRGRATF